MHTDTFERALTSKESIMVGWNIDPREDRRGAAVFALSDSGWRILAEASYPEMQWEAARDDLAARGLTQGGFDDSSDSVWYHHGSELGVWSDRKCLLMARDGVISSHVEKTFQYENIVRVIAYAGIDAVIRGLKLELKSGDVVTAMFDISSAAALMTEYDRYELLFDTAWLLEVGCALAECTGTYFCNEIK